jgi:dTDP-4-dehydrorhamnose reductase
MTIVVTGGDGQLGKTLQTAFTALQQGAPDSPLAQMSLIPVDLPDWDIADPGIVPRLAAMKPSLVIHCAAMTNVDGCARDPAAAYRINAFGTQNVALACQRAGAEMIHISTNEVFDGRSERPYFEFDPTGAINPYGASKLAGEEIASRLLHRLYIVRISWLFSRGASSFVSKILARAQEAEELRVVTDEVANPTYAPDLARGLLALAQTGHYGAYHLINEGYCSRFDFAREIVRQAGLGHIPVHPITSDMFDRPSTPPAFAPLHNTTAAALGIRLRPWQAALEDYFGA